MGSSAPEARVTVAVMPAWVGPGALRYVTPSGERWPEGRARVRACVRILMERTAYSQYVLDYGCGDGRLAPLFDPTLYLGWDQNPHLLERAREANPEHSFFEALDKLPVTPAASLVCAVFHHVPDPALPGILGNLCRGSREVYVLEPMEPRFRKFKDRPWGVFHRSPEQYAELAPTWMRFELLDTWDSPSGHCALHFGVFRPC